MYEWLSEDKRCNLQALIHLNVDCDASKQEEEEEEERKMEAWIKHGAKKYDNIPHTDTEPTREEKRE